MAKTTLAYGFFACVLAISLASGFGLYVVNRDRAVEQFQDRQLHAAFGVASTLRSEVGGLARTLRAIAEGTRLPTDERTIQRLLDDQFDCVEPPCFESAALYDATGRARYASMHPVGLGDEDIRQSLQWASDPSHQTGIRTAISSAETPSLVLLTPTPPSSRARSRSMRSSAGNSAWTKSGRDPPRWSSTAKATSSFTRGIPKCG